MRVCFWCYYQKSRLLFVIGFVVIKASERVNEFLCFESDFSYFVVDRQRSGRIPFIKSAFLFLCVVVKAAACCYCCLYILFEAGIRKLNSERIPFIKYSNVFINVYGCRRLCNTFSINIFYL